MCIVDYSLTDYWREARLLSANRRRLFDDEPSIVQATAVKIINRLAHRSLYPSIRLSARETLLHFECGFTLISGDRT